jgi:hypothetical protein
LQSRGGGVREENYNEKFDSRESRAKRGRTGGEEEERKREKKKREREKEEGILYACAFAQSGQQPAAGVAILKRHIYKYPNK